MNRGLELGVGSLLSQVIMCAQVRYCSQEKHIFLPTVVKLLPSIRLSIPSYFKSASKSMHILGEAFIPGFVKEA